jgi:alkylation response protein AidB-like acyl-CoA dehydrogenase
MNRLQDNQQTPIKGVQTLSEEKPKEMDRVDTSHFSAATAGGNEQKRQALEAMEEARKDYQLPSFGGQLFFGNFSPNLLFPYPEQNEEDKRFGDELTDVFLSYLQENLDPEEVDRTRTIPQKVIEEMKRMGIFALKVPKEYGGLGLSQTNYCRLVMRVASYCGATAVLISAHQSIGVPQPLKMFGTEAQKKKYFPRFRQGAISAFALTEPEVGSDPAQMSATATLTEEALVY